MINPSCFQPKWNYPPQTSTSFLAPIKGGTLLCKKKKSQKGQRMTIKTNLFLFLYSNLNSNLSIHVQTCLPSLPANLAIWDSCVQKVGLYNQYQNWNIFFKITRKLLSHKKQNRLGCILAVFQSVIQETQSAFYL